MKEKDDVLSEIRNSFSHMDGRFHILEQRVPVEVQMEYFKYSKRIKKERTEELTDIELDTFISELNDELTSAEYKCYILTCLAISRQVRSLRALEEYSSHPSEDVADWANLALMESRITIEAEFSDEKQVYISTGLGGKGNKLRFYVMLPSKGKLPFSDLHKTIIEREFQYYMSKDNSEIERLTINDVYVELVVLIPVQANIKTTLDNIINECNLYGDFLYDRFTITNVKELSNEEVQDILKKNYGDTEAGN